MNNFSYVKISDIGTVTTGRTPKTSNANNYGNDYMFIGPTDLHKHFFITESERMVTQQGFDSIKSSTLNGTSVLVGCIGWDMGNVGIVDAACVTNQQINSITNIKDSYNPYYIYYWLKTKKDFLFSQATVTRTPILNKSTFSNIEIYIPSERSLQDGLVEILIAIDKKIELNNQINAELEAMAKTLYDYWFVQFDFPNADGKPYKSTGGKVVYNEVLKREIPEGWEAKVLSDIANITMGQSPAGSSYNSEGMGTIFFQGSTDFGWLFPTTRQYTTEPSRMAKKGDILLSVRAPVGTMNIAKDDCCIGRGLAALNSKTGSDGFLFYVMQYYKQIFDYRNSEGTTFGSITKDDLYSLPLAYPTSDLLYKYDEIVSQSNKLVFEKGMENIQLEELKEWLLPMLMNGQVTVH